MLYIPGAIESGYEFEHIVLVYNLNDISDILEHWREVLDKIYFTNKPTFIFEHSYFLNLLYYHYIAPRDPNASNYYGLILDAYNGPVWEKQKLRLSKLKQYIDSKNIDFMVVTFPFLQDIGPGYKYRKAHEELDAFWNDSNVPNLDLLPYFEKYRAKDLIVHSRDFHPNELAHEIAAKAILDFLDKHIKTGAKSDSNAGSAN